MLIDLNINIDLGLSPDEVGALDRALTFYKETKGNADPIAVELCGTVKDLIAKMNQASQYVGNLNADPGDQTAILAPPQQLNETEEEPMGEEPEETAPQEEPTLEGTVEIDLLEEEKEEVEPEEEDFSVTGKSFTFQGSDGPPLPTEIQDMGESGP
jgi:hypothetical protein